MKTNQTKRIRSSTSNVQSSISILFLPLLLLLLALPGAAQAEDYTYTTNSGTITITGYTGPGGAVTIPDTITGLPVTSIGERAFSDCTSLTGVTIPDSVTNIGRMAFEECTSLIDVTLGISVTNIGYDPFAYCTNLAAITVDARNTHYSSVDGVLFNQNQTTLVQYPGGKAGTYTVPNSVTSIEDLAFADSVGLAAITVDAQNTHYSSVDGVLFNQNQTTLVQYPRGKAGTYTVPDGVTIISSFAFYGCTSLSSITIPDSVTEIEGWAFAECTDLTVYFEGNAPSDEWPSAGAGPFYGADKATVYFLPGTTGWGATFGYRPTAPWVLPNPLILTGDPSFGAHTNGFGFIISWATNLSGVVEACTDLANPLWSPLGTNTLIDGSSYFSDPEWTNYPSRFYRIVGQ